MRKWTCLIGLCCVLWLFAGCAAYTAPVVPPPGLIFSGYTAPLSTDFSGQSVGTKQGSATSLNILGLFTFGNCGIRSAAQDGNLNTISYCDYSYLNVFGIVQTFTTIAHGE